jgi:hypothetical protein
LVEQVLRLAEPEQRQRVRDAEVIQRRKGLVRFAIGQGERLQDALDEHGVDSGSLRDLGRGEQMSWQDRPPVGRSNSPTFGHFKIPHHEGRVTER